MSDSTLDRIESVFGAVINGLFISIMLLAVLTIVALFGVSN